MSSKKLLAQDIKEALKQPISDFKQAEALLQEALALAQLVLKDEEEKQ